MAPFLPLIKAHCDLLSNQTYTTTNTTRTKTKDELMNEIEILNESLSRPLFIKDFPNPYIAINKIGKNIFYETGGKKRGISYGNTCVMPTAAAEHITDGSDTTPKTS